MANGLLSNEELVDTLIADVNMLVKSMASGQYVQFCLIITQITQKLANLKAGIKSDIDNKNKVIETLKEHIRNMGEEVTDMGIEEYLQNHAIKDGGDNGGS